MPHPLGVPPSGPPPMGPPLGGPPDAKRQRTGGLVLEPEEEFLAKYPGPSKVRHFACCLSTCINCVLYFRMVHTNLQQVTGDVVALASLTDCFKDLALSCVSCNCPPQCR